MVLANNSTKVHVNTFNYRPLTNEHINLEYQSGTQIYQRIADIRERTRGIAGIWERKQNEITDHINSLAKIHGLKPTNMLSA